MKKIIAAAVAAFILPAAAMAAPEAYVVPYVGIFDVTDDNNSTQFGAEYRHRDVFYGLRPTAGLSIDTDGGVYGYGGLNWDIPLGASGFYLTPNFMAGLYHRGDSKRLGGPIEFRSGIEGSYQFNNGHRAGVAFNHISNANIYNRNPGAETLLFNYAIPLSSAF